jgi:hypothetical protein
MKKYILIAYSDENLNKYKYLFKTNLHIDSNEGDHWFWLYEIDISNVDSLLLTKEYLDFYLNLEEIKSDNSNYITLEFNEEKITKEFLEKEIEKLELLQNII